MPHLTLTEIINNLYINDISSPLSSGESIERDKTPSLKDYSSDLTLSSPSLSPVKVDKYLIAINEFYNKLDDKTIYKIIDIINRKSNISLRLIEWFVSKYSQSHIIDIYTSEGLPFNIYNSYHIKTKVYEKKYFDLFRRVDVMQYKFKNNDKMTITTTVSQLNFFMWLIENNIFKYIEDNRDQLSKLMSSDNAIERDRLKRKALLKK